MKKNAPNARVNSGVRKAGSRTPQVAASRTYRTGNSTSSSRKSSKKKGKNNGAVIGGVILIAVVIIAIAGVCLFFKFGDKILEEKYEVTYSDGTVAKLTVDELSTELSSDVFYQGIKIDGIDVSGKSKEEALALVSEQFSQKPSEVDMSLSFKGTVYPLDLSSFPLENNASDIIDEAFTYARPSAEATPEELVSCFALHESLKTAPKEYNTAYTIKTDGLSEVIHGILDPYNKEAKPARVDSFNVATCEFQVSPSEEGCSVDIDKAVTDTKALLDSRTYQGTITVDYEDLIPASTTEDLTAGMGLISSTTSNTTSDNSRNHNIRITCEKLDGLVIQPGGSFSFNDYIGERTVDKGYEEAGVILDGKSDKGLGGGICQVSTMIYQSVSKADLQIDERHPHDWPSTYCLDGLDATVDWPGLDFKFTNTSGYPIALHAFYDVDAYQVTVQVYGHKFEDGSYIALNSTSSTTSYATTTYVADSSMPVGTTEKEMSPHDGKTAQSFKIWYDKDGNVIKEEEYASSYYRQINGVIKVGVLNPDGTLATVDPATGELTGAMDETESTDETQNTDESLPPPPTGETETQNTVETPPTTPPEDTTPSEPMESNVSPDQ